MSRFATKWDDGQDQIVDLEAEIMATEVERDALREFIEDAIYLIKVASFASAEDDYDASEWIKAVMQEFPGMVY